MQELVRTERAKQSKKRAINDLIALKSQDLLAVCFAHWAHRDAVQEETRAVRSKTDSPRDSPMDISVGIGAPSPTGKDPTPQNADGDDRLQFAWRVAEVYRTMVKRQCGKAESGHLSGIFRAWRRHVIYRRHVDKRQAPKAKRTDEAGAVGADLLVKLKGGALLAELGTIEALYESRVAAAERLLSFLVVFHAAVRPLAKLPFIGFDIDRSESRLRVASTPAPIPFVEAHALAVPSAKRTGAILPVLSDDLVMDCDTNL